MLGKRIHFTDEETTLRTDENVPNSRTQGMNWVFGGKAMSFPCRRAIRMSQLRQAVLVWSKEALGTLPASTQAHLQYNKKNIPRRNTKAIPFSIYFMV